MSVQEISPNVEMTKAYIAQLWFYWWLCFNFSSSVLWFLANTLLVEPLKPG